MFKWMTPGKSFADDRVLAEMSQSLEPGSNHCIIGPSGSGKTTLLNLLSGLDSSQPSVWQSGKPQVGYLFQQPRLLPWRTLRQNLLLVSDNQERVESMLDAVKLLTYADHYPAQISLGMARRAALARCLLLEPDLVLMDEPLVSLDAPTATEMRELIQRLVCDHPQRCLIYVTHDLKEALQMADQITVIGEKPSRIIFTAPSESLTEADLEGHLRNS